MINIAVLITCHNRKHKTVKCLQKLYSQNNIENIKLKVFLVDDGSSDGTGQTVKELFPDITIIKGSGNLFWAKGMALAWKESLKSHENFDYYLWLNDDTFLYNTTLSELIKTQINKTEIVVGSVCDPITKLTTYGGGRFTNRFLRPFKYELVKVNGNPQKIDIFNGNVVLIPNSVYNKIGMMDNYFEHAFADIEYSLRAAKHNVKILLTAKHIAECKRDNLDHNKIFNISLLKKILNLFDKKQKPLKSWFRLCYKYGGILWPIHFFIGYVKSILKILLEHKYFKKN
tara:strand:+ start:399 stop:1256 length:858 start_codon:yes stop_codon:yes gene_type:complete